MPMTLTRLDFASWGGFMVFSTSSVITPICLPAIMATLSTTLSEGGGMETARTGIMLTVLILSGILARRWGKKVFLAGGQFLLAVGLLMASMAEQYLTLTASLMMMGIGGGVMEALISPLVVDLHPDDSGTYMNVTHAFYPVGVVVSALLFGELLTLGVSWRWLYRITAAEAFVIALLFTIFHFPKPADGDHSTGGMIGRILRLPGFWLFAVAIFLGAGVESAFTFWSTSYVAAYLKNVPRAGAFAVVIFAAMMALGRLLMARLSTRVSLKALMGGSALLGLAVSAVIPYASNLWLFYALLAVAGLAAACFWPTILAEAAACLNVDATLLFVMLSCAGIAGFGFAPWLLGLIGDQSGLKAAFAAMPVFFIILLVALVFEWRMGKGGHGSAQK